VYETGLIKVGNWFLYGNPCSSWGFHQSALQFNDLLDQIGGLPIVRATLQLSVRSIPGDWNTVYKCHAFAGEWSPSTITFNNCPFYYIDGAGTAEPPITTILPLEFDVTTIVLQWMSGAWVNNGLFLRDPNFPDCSYCLRQSECYSDDYYEGMPEDRPRIYVEFAK
jgi:hypothetical protein